jgi:excinuclease ABC subunit C
MCDAPCIDLISEKEYNKNIEKVKKVLSGKTKDLIYELDKEMKKLSSEKKYELALKIRNEIQALNNLNERQNMKRERKYNEDIISYIIENKKIYLMLFNIYKGTLYNKKEYIFDYKNDFLEEFLIQYYSQNPIPKDVIIPEEIDSSINLFLEKKRGSKINIKKPIRGEKKQLLDLVEKNIELTFFSNKNKIKILQEKLKLDEPPKVIECFDISHLSGTSTVGSMVQFRNGKPDKNNYRRFKIRTVEGIDDFMAIAEVVRRRYIRLKKENRDFPDLIIVDGGKGQLNFSLKELEKIGAKIPIISIAKKFEEIYIPGRINPLKLSRKDKALHFIQEIRNEAHRFAIKYNKLLRRKELIQ